jgi:hypothetical protein
MSKWMFGLVLLPLLLTACQAKQERMKQSQRNAIVDSIIGSKMQEVNRQAMEDLDRRMAIEVKAKADSIVLSKQDTLKKDAAPPDNTLPNNIPVP